MKVCIIGLGLIGGSLALSLKKLPFINEIYGIDHNIEHQSKAIKYNLVDKIIDFKEIKEIDIIILAIPVNGILSIMKQLDEKIKETATIIDLGSTKETIVKNIPANIRENFVAAHPMTGNEHSGPDAAIEGLYNDKVVVLCNFEQSGKLQQEIAVRIFSGIHMNIIYMDAHKHDRHAAFISHMPHIISYSIANTVLRQEDKHNILSMAAGGFRSMSRLANSSPNMWEDIFKQNKDNVLNAIDIFQIELDSLKKSIKNEEWDNVYKKIDNGNKLKDIFS